MSRLGLRIGLASYLAHDQIGLDILSAMHGEDVGTSVVHVDSPSHTARNFVLSFAGERTILVRHAEFNYHWTGLRDHEVPAWLYINSLGPDALTYQDELADWLDQYPNVLLAFYPGTFQLEAGAERLARLYARAEVLLCSSAGAEAIIGAPAADSSTVLDALLRLGAHSVVVFDESGGAIAANDSERLRIEPFTDPQPPLDLTGARDAFASTTVAALVRGMPLREALRWASVNATATSRQFGTQSGLLRLDDLVNRLDATESEFVAQDF
jgi:sugar/nucleoside kinase (ribokinase family)